MALTGKIMDFFADKAMTIPAFPRTKVKAVSDDNNIGLNVLLDAKASKEELDAKMSKTESDMTALFASGNTILSSNQFGNELPAPGNAGRIFFKKVSD